jgi:hypothetical protein
VRKDELYGWWKQLKHQLFIQENVLDAIIDVREYDVPYVMRVGIDNEIFVGLWYR